MRIDSKEQIADLIEWNTGCFFQNNKVTLNVLLSLAFEYLYVS